MLLSEFKKLLQKELKSFFGVVGVVVGGGGGVVFEIIGFHVKVWFKILNVADFWNNKSYSSVR